MDTVFTRTGRVIGKEGLDLLSKKTVAVFGLGGVGSYAAEALVRIGVGHLIFIDKDETDVTNMNRQLVADLSTLGRKKADIMTERAHRIRPDMDARGLSIFYRPGDGEWLASLKADFIIDAIDDVPAKVSLAEECTRRHIPEISCMGTGNRLDPGQLRVEDISKTSVCHLARKMRRLLKERGIYHLPVVYSRESPVKPIGEGHTPGSVSFVPPVAGFLMAGFVVRALLKELSPAD